MNIDMEMMLRADAERVGRHIATRSIPPSPSARHRRPLLVPKMLAGGLVAASLAITVVISVGRDTKRTIEPAPPADSSATTKTLSSVATSALTAPIDSSAPSIGVPLGSTANEGGPAAFGVVPDGYRVVLANVNTAGSAATATDTTDGWVATFIRRPGNDSDLAAYIQVQIERVTGSDPFEGFPGLAETPDVTMGSFTGKVVDLASGYPTLVVVLGDSQRILIGGRTSVADIEVVADGLQLRADSAGADATTLPEGYELVDESPIAGSVATQEWTVSYAREQLTSSLVTIRARRNPKEPALLKLLFPSGARTVDINGFSGVVYPFGITFDVSPTYQIDLSREPRGASISDDDLIVLARSIVAISDQQFGDLQRQANQHPLSPTDMPCSFYVTRSDPQSDVPLSQTDSGWAVPVPGSFTIDLTARQPLRDVTVGIQSPDSTDITPLVIVDQLTQYATVNVAWDGTIKGAQAPPGNYQVTLAASPAEPAAGQCTADPTPSSGSLNITFEVG